MATTETKRRWLRASPYVLGVVLWALLYLAPQHAVLFGAVEPTLKGPDSYMRMVRVTELYESGAWFDGTIERSNAPYGDTLHWTRPLDVVILAGTWLLSPFIDAKAAIHWSGVFSSSLLHLLIALTAPWLVAPLIDRDNRYFAIFIALIQPAIYAYSMVGRADHHTLQALLLAVSVGFTLRLLQSPDDRRAAFAAGAAAAVGLWVSLELFVPLAVALTAMALVWLRYGDDRLPAYLRYASGLAVMVAFAIVIERPPDDWMTVEYDRISVVHLVVALVIVGFWGALHYAVRCGVRIDSPGRRALSLVLAGIVALALLFALLPKFFGGPWVEADPEIVRLFTDRSPEFRALWPTRLGALSDILVFLGPALIGAPFLAMILTRERRSGGWAGWLYIALGLAAFLPLAMMHLRFAADAAILLIVVLTAILARLRLRFAARAPKFGGALYPALIFAGVLVGPIALGGALAKMGSVAAEPRAGPGCRLDDVLVDLNRPDSLGARPRVIVARLNLGPRLLYATPHAVLGAPYVRNRDGIRDGMRILETAVDDEARRLMRARGADLILVCAHSRTGGGLASRLAAGEVPEWLRPVDQPHSIDSGYRMFELTEGRAK